jgi:sulfatase modifying factor 1
MNKNNHAAMQNHGLSGDQVMATMKKMTYRCIATAIAGAALSAIFSIHLQAGTIAPSAGPGSTMVTLEQIHHRLSAFNGPSVLDGSTNGIMDGYYDNTTLDTVEPDLVAANIRTGVVIFGITGTGTFTPPQNMVLIPAGEFVMGDALDNTSASLPLHTNYISAFYMDQYEVTKALWDEVKAFNGGNGYQYTNPGLGKATNHPVHTVNWYDVVKWCNARSEMEGLTPVYYTNENFTAVYKRDLLLSPYINWSANGYRLPTEAEWEKAARGGVSSKRFPWGNTIKHSDANYRSSASYAYDTSNTRDYHPIFYDLISPYTSPVGYFAPNGYGLYDMTGNVSEWCWDLYGSSYYSSSPSTDPNGPSSGSFRVVRGGDTSLAPNATVARRGKRNPIQTGGVRCARGL